MPTATLHLVSASLSDQGRVRRANQDTAAFAPELGAFLVCDGMGGAAAGELASQLAAQAFLASLRTTLSRLARPDNAPSATPQARLHDAVQAANHAVHNRSRQQPELEGMGTTLIGLLFLPPPTHDRRARPRPSRFQTPPDLYLVNVGDSRCYRRRAGTLLQLSTDHSFVEDQVRAGHITPEQAARSPMRNYITRAVGPSPNIEADVEAHRTQPGDLYLLCSDGLTRELDDSTLGALLDRDLPTGSPSATNLERAAQALVQAANEHGGYDNITVLLIACPE